MISIGIHLKKDDFLGIVIDFPELVEFEILWEISVYTFYNIEILHLLQWIHLKFPNLVCPYILYRIEIESFQNSYDELE
tara:strand:+ start:377 stop:613 length:237 start_codon:yes stop_codon:yes gene_type:complete